MSDPKVDEVTDRQQHHVDLQNAYVGLYAAERGLERLSADISGHEEVPKDASTKEPNLSLETVLDEAGDIIRTVSGRIEKLTEEIRAKLF